MSNIATSPQMPVAPQSQPMHVTRPSAASDPAKMWKAARDFEAMVLGEFLKPMFETTEDTKNLFGGGEAEKTWKPMLVSEIGKQIAASGGLGLAAPIHDAMLKMQGARP
jgi:flagellar protein FlgJ